MASQFELTRKYLYELRKVIGAGNESKAKELINNILAIKTILFFVAYFWKIVILVKVSPRSASVFVNIPHLMGHFIINISTLPHIILTYLFTQF
jgi:hypothetical protein